eukprot:scaffold32358_cov31-Tisochrysis_lutea.AAC.4
MRREAKAGGRRGGGDAGGERPMPLDRLSLSTLFFISRRRSDDKCFRGSGAGGGVRLSAVVSSSMPRPPACATDVQI